MEKISRREFLTAVFVGGLVGCNPERRKIIEFKPGTNLQQELLTFADKSLKEDNEYGGAYWHKAGYTPADRESGPAEVGFSNEYYDLMIQQAIKDGEKEFYQIHSHSVASMITGPELQEVRQGKMRLSPNSTPSLYRTSRFGDLAQVLRHQIQYGQKINIKGIAIYGDYAWIYGGFNTNHPYYKQAVKYIGWHLEKDEKYFTTEQTMEEVKFKALNNELEKKLYKLCMKITKADIKKDQPAAQAIITEICGVYRDEVGMNIGLWNIKTQQTIF